MWKRSTEKDQASYDIPFILRNDTNELIYKTETGSETYRVNLWLPGGKGGIDWEFGIDMYTLLYLK